MNNSSTSSSSRWPLAALTALALVALTNLALTPYLAQQTELFSRFRAEYSDAMKDAADSPASLVVLGNSLMWPLSEKGLAAALYDRRGEETKAYALGAAMPITHRILLETHDYGIVKQGGVVLYSVTPIDINRNTDTLAGTIENYYRWGDFFTHLVVRGRYGWAKHFLAQRSMGLLIYRQEFQELMRRKLYGEMQPEPPPPEYFADTEKYPEIGDIVELRDPAEYSHQNETAMTPRLDPDFLSMDFSRLKDLSFEDMSRAEARIWSDQHCGNYQVDPYQVAKIKEIVTQLREKRGATVVLMTPPLSELLKENVGEERLGVFRQTIRQIADELNAPLLDYLDDPRTRDYVYFDSVHLGKRSSADWLLLLVQDIQPLLQ
ncbi:SGNH/GDSL hydrolase family protein [Candidatus Sumerlaeota bacterium]|nr:SGNH/GDSL hydrolase family protein [Candidatus Sumerlaeota bacterium]